MSRITTLTDLKQNDTDKIKATMLTLRDTINKLKIDEFKNKRYISALERQIVELSNQLKSLKETPQIDLVSILREINDDTIKNSNMTKSQILELDNEISQKIKNLLV